VTKTVTDHGQNRNQYWRARRASQESSGDLVYRHVTEEGIPMCGEHDDCNPNKGD
jgi:hypothetical protein